MIIHNVGLLPITTLRLVVILNLVIQSLVVHPMGSSVASAVSGVAYGTALQTTLLDIKVLGTDVL